jgi:GxxExxY protein
LPHISQGSYATPGYIRNDAGEFSFQDQTYNIIGICKEVHRVLGHRFLEILYKDAIEYELMQRQLDYGREKEYMIQYKGVILSHNFFADFL